MGTVAWWQLQWVWMATGWVLCALGLWVLGWALFWDRAKGRRRCPKCWYEMAGVPGLRCPECGREAKREATLQRTRRKWFAALAGGLSLKMAYVALHMHAIWAGSWVSLVPSFVLAASAVTDCGVTYVPPTPAATVPATKMSLASRGFAQAMTRPAAIAAPKNAKEALGREAWMRIQKKEMWGWQARWFVGRALESDRSAWEKHVTIPARWVAGVKMPMRVLCSQPHPGWQVWMGDYASASMASWDGDVRSDHVVTMQATPKSPGTMFFPQIEFRSTKNQTFQATFSKSCQLVATVDELFTADATEKTAEIARLFLNPRLLRESDGRVTLVVNDRYNHPAWESMRTGLGCRLEIVVNGKVVGTSKFAPNWNRCSNWYSTEVPVVWADGAAPLLQQGDANIQIRMKGDPKVSLIAYSEWPFDDPKPRCWTGRAEVDAPIRPRESETRKIGTRKADVRASE